MLNVSAVDPAVCRKTLVENLENWTPERKDLKSYLDWVLERFYESHPNEARLLVLSLNKPQAEDRLIDLIKLAIFKEACLEEVHELEEVRSVMEGAFDAIEKERVVEGDVMPYRLALSLLRETDNSER